MGLRLLLINANSVTLRLVLLIRVIFEAISISIDILGGTLFHAVNYTGFVLQRHKLEQTGGTV